MADTTQLRPKGVLLTSSDLDAWNDELANLVKTRNHIETQISELEEKISLAKDLIAMITPRAAEPKPEWADKQEKQPVPLPEAIYDIVQKSGGTATYYEIKSKLARDLVQSSRMKSNPNYFYTAIKRLKDREMVIQNGTSLVLVNLNALEQLPFDSQETKNPTTEVAGS